MHTSDIRQAEWVVFVNFGLHTYMYVTPTNKRVIISLKERKRVTWEVEGKRGRDK